MTTDLPVGNPHREREGTCARCGDSWPCVAAMVVGVHPKDGGDESVDDGS